MLGLELGSERVESLVVEAQRTGRKSRDLDACAALLVVLDLARGHGPAIRPGTQPPRHAVVGPPARRQRVTGSLVAFLGARDGHVGRQEHLGGLLESHQAPAARSRAAHAVEIRPADVERRGAPSLEEVRVGRDRGLDGDVTEAVAPLGGARLAARVRYVDADGIGVGHPVRRLALVGLRRELDVETALGIEIRLAAGDQFFAAGRPGTEPAPPVRIPGAPHDPPGDIAFDHRQAEVVARVTREARRAIQAQGLGRLRQGHLESGPLVLLDLHQRLAADRGSQLPAPEQPSGRNLEAPRGAAEGVALHFDSRDLIVVRVHEIDRELA